jgi:hypothetical protein
MTLPLSAVFYAAILLPAIPVALIVWKVKSDMDDIDDFAEYLRIWFMIVVALVFAPPALAIGNTSAAACQFLCRAPVPVRSHACLLQRQRRQLQQWPVSAHVCRFFLLQLFVKRSVARAGQNSSGHAALCCSILSLASGLSPPRLC